MTAPTFNPETPPPGFELKLIDHWRDRPQIVPRLQLVHTNAASGQGTVDSAFRHANQWSPSYVGPDVTVPHFQIDRDGRAAMLLPLDRMGIHAYKANSFAIGMETADTGTVADPAISPFTDAQAEQVAVALAYGALGYDIPLTYPAMWDGTGSACHTEPFTYPDWTKYQGKSCPGPAKKAQVRDVILGRAADILTAWTTPPPTGDNDMTPEQSAQLDDIHRALFDNDYPFPGMVNMRTQVDRTYTIMGTFWDGFPGNIKDGPGVLARTIKNIAAKVGAKVG